MRLNYTLSLLQLSFLKYLCCALYLHIFVLTLPHFITFLHSFIQDATLLALQDKTSVIYIKYQRKQTIYPTLIFYLKVIYTLGSSFLNIFLVFAMHWKKIFVLNIKDEILTKCQPFIIFLSGRQLILILYNLLNILIHSFPLQLLIFLHFMESSLFLRQRFPNCMKPRLP